MSTERETNSLLLERYKDGDTDAREKIISLNLPLVKSIARRFGSCDTSSEDLFHIGIIGLIKAVEGYDAKHGCAFSTYAFSLISGEIRRYLRDDGIIRVSRRLKKNASAVLEAKKNFYVLHGREPHTVELSEICRMTPEEISDCLEALQPIHSIFESHGDGEGLTMAETIAQDDVFSPIVDILALNQELERLDDTQKQLIRLRFYKNLTQSQTAKVLGTSQVTVCRMEKKILSQLKENLICE